MAPQIQNYEWETQRPDICTDNKFVEINKTISISFPINQFMLHDVLHMMVSYSYNIICNASVYSLNIHYTDYFLMAKKQTKTNFQPQGPYMHWYWMHDKSNQEMHQPDYSEVNFVKDNCYN